MNKIKRELTYAEALREALAEEMRRSDEVIVMGIDVGIWGNLYGVTKGLLEEFGEARVKDTPISEAAIAGCGIGAALLGLRPVIEIMYIDLIPISMDQIVNHAAKLPFLTVGKAKVPLVIRTQGGVGLKNAALHSQSLESWFVNVPGLVVVMPSTPYDAKGLLKSAIRDDRPVMFIEHKMLYRVRGPVPAEDYLIPLGKSSLKRKGDDITIVATSWMVGKTLKAAEILSKEGIEAEIIDPCTLVPLDKEPILESVRRTGKCVVVHEAPKTGGWGGEIASVVMEDAFDYLDAPVKRIAGLDVPVPYGKETELQVVPSTEKIVKGVKELFARPTTKS